MAWPNNRTFVRICDTCSRSFEARSANRKRCPDCCRCPECGQQLPDATRRFCGLRCAHLWLERNLTAEAKAVRSENISAATKGKPKLALRGENNPLWKGGKKDRRDVMEHLEYRVWRATVYERDAHRCVICGTREHNLQAHHIHPWKKHPGLRYDPENGVTLCRACHEPMSQREELFEAQLLAYVATRVPVELTEEQRRSLTPLVCECDRCGKALVRPGSDREKRFHFCNRVCKQAFEAAEPVTAFGRTQTIMEWSKEPFCTVGYIALYHRLQKGEAPESAITAGSRDHADQTHCPQGHPFTPENTLIRPSEGHRRCRICQQARDRERGTKRQTINGVRTRKAA